MPSYFKICIKLSPFANFDINSIVFVKSLFSLFDQRYKCIAVKTSSMWMRFFYAKLFNMIFYFLDLI